MVEGEATVPTTEPSVTSSSAGDGQTSTAPQAAAAAAAPTEKPKKRSSSSSKSSSNKSGGSSSSASKDKGEASGAGGSGGTKDKENEKSTEKHSTGDLWKHLVSMQKSGDVQSVAGDSSVVFVGSRQSGKTTLINKFLFPDKDETPKPTLGLEYLYSRRTAKDGTSKDVAHLWEIGGGKSLSKLLSVTLTQQSLPTATVVIVVDLTKPSEVLPSVLHWLEAVRARIVEVDKEARAKKIRIVEKLKQRAAKRFGEKHPDNVSKEGEVGKGYIRHTGINMIVACSNFDTFRNQDAELKKIMFRTLRFVCHTNGMSLLATSSKDKTSVSAWRMLLNSAAFSLAPVHQKVSDHLKSVFVPAGNDAIQDIGPPPKQDIKQLGKGTTPLDLWRKVFEAYFGAVPADDANDEVIRDARIDPTGQFVESAIDDARASKEDELARYCAEQAVLEMTPSADVKPSRTSSSSSSSSKSRSAAK